VTALDVKASAEFEMRFLEAVLDDEPLLSDRMLELGEWMAQYYLAPLGEVLRGMLPLMAEVRRTVYYRITDLGRDVLAGSLDGETWDSQVRKSGSGVPSFSAWGLSEKRGGVKRKGSSCPKNRLGTPRTGAAGKGRAGKGLYAAHGYGRPRCQCWQEWCGRSGCAGDRRPWRRDARRMERFAVLIPEARLPSLTAKQQAILAELCGLRRRAAFG